MASSLSEGWRVRPVEHADFDAIHSIYAEQVLHASASFELELPSVDELRRRAADVAARGLPYLVAVDQHSRLGGYAYAGVYRTRPADRYTVENSVYVDARLRGSGLGSRLMQSLIEGATAAGCRQMIAVIGDSANAGSIALHRRFGFQPIGILPAVGYKFDRWIDSVLMQRALGPGATAAPDRLRR